MNVNSIFLLGRLAQNPELHLTTSGQNVCNMSIATSRTYKDRDGNKKEDVEFHRIVVYGNQAKSCAQFLTKGQLAQIDGRLKTRSYEKDGRKRYITEIVAERIQFGPRIAPKGQNGTQDASNPDNDPDIVPEHEDTASGEIPGKTTVRNGIEYPAIEISPEDIPF